jgi:DNA gyrase/topoisomerase IV subunit B
MLDKLKFDISGDDFVSNQAIISVKLLNQFEGQAKRNLEEEKFEIPWRQAVGK